MTPVRLVLVVGIVALASGLAGLLEGSLVAGIVAASGGLAVVLGGLGSRWYGPLLALPATTMLTASWLEQRPPWLIIATLNCLLLACAMHLASPMLSRGLVLAPLAWTSTPLASGAAVLLGVLGAGFLTRKPHQSTPKDTTSEVIDLRTIDLTRFESRTYDRHGQF